MNMAVGGYTIMKQLDLYYDEVYIRLDELCKILSISTATARNWLKSGKIKPVYSQGREEFFLREDIDLLLDNIKEGKESRLKSRRNKQHVTGTFIPRTYIQSKVGIEIVEAIISEINLVKLPNDYERIILAEYALKLLVSRKIIKHNDKSESSAIINDFIRDKEFTDPYSSLIDDILSDITEIDIKIHQLKSVLCHEVDYIEDQDFLGLLFMSLQCVGERKSKGVYYTPLTVVKEAVDNLHMKKALHGMTKLVDACCGTGNFLMYAYKYVQNLEKLHGYDICPLSVYLTRINMVLVSKTDDIHLLNKNYICKDALKDNEDSVFDVVIGNPPWGFKYELEQEAFLRSYYFSAQAKTIESFCVFTEYALKIVGQNGIVSLILPQSLLNVKLHQPVRDYMLDNCNIKRIRYWENIFDGVQCPAMTLTFEKKPNTFSTKGLEVVTDKREFLIGDARRIDRTNWHFDLTDEEPSLIDKMESSVKVTYLKQNADFALGIVTGNNSKHILNYEFDGSEIILKGSDIFKYQFIPSNNFIKFEPENFQQVAPANLYRAKEKLIYRFICDSLVFAYDDSQTLTLNSANVLIPIIKGLNVKYVLAVLNSRAIQYYFKHKFKSIKILRSHIEDLPIPVISSSLQNEIINKVDGLLTSKDPSRIQQLYEEIDAEITKLFRLTDAEHDLIKEKTSHFNLFLLGK